MKKKSAQPLPLLPFIPNATCPKCGSDVRIVVYKHDKDGERLESTCTTCSFAWQNACLDAAP
jgi:DNA-directed RNA polymerase subunit M/transcription elongation factor TFIIS